jgi:abortive infection bacteriophage resistance protein
MTDKKITIGDLIKYDYDAERVIEFKVENVVEKLLRAPIKSVLEDIEKDYNIKHNLSKEELQNLNRFSEIRNLYAHRRGIIDKKLGV